MINALRGYHHHRILGLSHLPARGPTIVATNHSLATYDLVLLMAAIYEAYGRFPRALIDRLFYKVPGLGKLMQSLGCVAGSQANARSLLDNGEILYLAPGGMQEALRSSKEKYQIFWEQRKGFARLAIEVQAPIVLAACPSADDIFHVIDNPFTQWAYQKFKVPLFLAKGLGLSGIPRPVRLTHWLSKPYLPPKHPRGQEAPKELVDEFHKQLVLEMKKLMNRASVNLLNSIPLPKAKPQWAKLHQW